jgi:hypothetical protein
VRQVAPALTNETAAPLATEKNELPFTGTYTGDSTGINPPPLAQSTDFEHLHYLPPQDSLKGRTSITTEVM